jgi:hypothetical protein
MASTNLSQNRATQRILKHRLAAVITLARREATKAIKAQFRAQGVKLSEVPAKTIHTFANAYYERLIAEAKQIIATSPLFADCQRICHGLEKDTLRSKTCPWERAI